ncbi:unnamed protein product, partial [Cylicocyclus nassatus]
GKTGLVPGPVCLALHSLVNQQSLCSSGFEFLPLVYSNGNSMSISQLLNPFHPSSARPTLPQCLKLVNALIYLYSRNSSTLFAKTKNAKYGPISTS